ncbi:transmembrane protein-like, partial [Tropilaelaps mercedesae]
MGALSKLMVSLPYNCYEVAHPWSETCTYAWTYVFLACAREAGKIYSLLSLFSQLGLSRNVSLKAFWKTFTSSARSTIFLSYNVFYFLLFICLFRHGSDRLYLPQSTFLSG